MSAAFFRWSRSSSSFRPRRGFMGFAEEGKAGRRTIRGRTFDNERLTIDMEPTSPSSALVEIRVGRIGNKERSREFHKALQKYLKRK